MKRQTIHRRSFLKKSTISLLGIATIPAQSSSLFSIKKRRKWGIILNTVREEMKRDVKGTLRNLAELGYEYIEGGVYGDDSKAYAKLLKDLGLKPIVGGSSMGSLQKDLDTYIKNANILKQKYITCYWPWLSSANNLTKDECLKAADNLNKIGERVRKEGFRFTWHNHDKEFVKIQDMTAFDILMKETDPNLVGVQLDLYWVQKGGYDPVKLFHQYPGRFDLAHVKDMANDLDKGIVCVGSGVMDFQQIMDNAGKSGIKYYIVEHEKSIKGMECARTSIKHLKSIR